MKWKHVTSSKCFSELFVYWHRIVPSVVRHDDVFSCSLYRYNANTRCPYDCVPACPSIPQFLRTYSIKVFKRTLHFRVPIRVKYSSAPSIPHFWYTYSIKIFKRTLDSTIPRTCSIKVFCRTHDQSISAYLFDKNIQANP